MKILESLENLCQSSEMSMSMMLLGLHIELTGEYCAYRFL